MGTADRNFTVKLTLAEANVVRNALKDRHQELFQISVDKMTEAEKTEVGQIEKLLRIDF